MRYVNSEFRIDFRPTMQSLHALTDGLIDYAGLFPPAALGMRQAVENYGSYVAGSNRSMLGSFVVPAARLDEFSAEALPIFPRGSAPPWSISAILGSHPESELKAIGKFNDDHRAGSAVGHAVIESVEFKAMDSGDIERVKAALPDSCHAFVEIAKGRTELLDATNAVGFSAKLRTGGVEQNAFPAPGEIISFIEACRERDLSFKATAGLHHIVCGTYPLTYQENAAKGEMFGFLNVFLAAAYLHSGLPASVARDLLVERNPSAFRFKEESLEWHGRELSVSQIRQVRKKFALSYGSCSFTEPVDELRAMLEQQGR